jgi:hypothetical protein
MEVQFIDKKIEIFQNILSLNNEIVLNELQNLISTYLIEYEKTSSKSSHSKPIPFEEWNMQFTDNQSLSENLPDLGITLGEFRKKIYEAEFGNYITLPEFEKCVKGWKTKKSSVKS